MKLIEAMDRAILGNDTRLAIVVSGCLEAMGLNHEGQLQYLQLKYPKLTAAEWDALLYAGEHDSELVDYGAFSKITEKHQ